MYLEKKIYLSWYFVVRKQHIFQFSMKNKYTDFEISWTTKKVWRARVRIHAERRTPPSLGLIY